MQQSQDIESNGHHYFWDLLLLFLFFNHFGESIYDLKKKIIVIVK